MRINRSAALACLCAYWFSPPVLSQLPLPPIPVPPENPLTEAKIKLGKTLFWEEQLSLTGTVACGTCHRPGAGHSDPRSAVAGFATVHPGPNGFFGTGGDDIRASAGVPLHGADGLYQLSQYFGVTPQVGKRKSPPVTSAAYAPLLFWDGRASSTFNDPISGAVLIAQGGALESQALAPFLDTSEMGHVGNEFSGIAGRIGGAKPLALAENVPVDLATWIGTRDYPALFNEAFGTPQVTPARMAFALASYERALNATQTPLDRELAGTPTLTPQERLGRQVFEALECSVCHAEALHSDNSFRYIGVRPVDDDLGRFTQTADPAHRGQFRVPSLRNVALRAPFMHNGGLPTLDTVISFYMRGGDFTAPNKDPLIRFRSITGPEREGLLAYLTHAITDPRIAEELPPFDRPTLFSESARAPALIGTTNPATFAPLIGAREPSHASNARFTVSVSRARVGATATLVVGRADPGIVPLVPVGDVFTVTKTISAGNTFSGGYAVTQLDLSQDPSLVGDTLFGRWYIADPNAPNGLAVTQAFRITVFAIDTAPVDLIMRDGFE